MNPFALFTPCVAVRGLVAELQAGEQASTNAHFITSSAELKARIAKLLHVTKPDFVVFVPEVSGSASDTGNEWFPKSKP